MISEAVPTKPGKKPTASEIDFTAMPRVLGRLNRLALRYPWRFALAIACALGAAVFNLVTPRLLGEAVDHAYHLLEGGAIAQHDTQLALYRVSALLVLSCALRGLLSGLQTYMGENLAQRVGFDLRLAFFEQLQRLSFSFHDTSHSGDLIARGMLDLEGIRAYLEMGVLRIVTLVLLVGLGAWRLLGIDPVLGALALSFVPFVMVRAGYMGVRLRRTWLALQRMMSQLTLGMEENLQGLRVVRAFASQRREMQRFDHVSDQALALSNQRITTRMASMSVMNFGAGAFCRWSRGNGGHTQRRHAHRISDFYGNPAATGTFGGHDRQFQCPCNIGR